MFSVQIQLVLTSDISVAAGTPHASTLGMTTTTNWNLESATFTHTSSEGISAQVTVTWRGEISGTDEMRAQSENWTLESNRILHAARRIGLPLMG